MHTDVSNQEINGVKIVIDDQAAEHRPYKIKNYVLRYLKYIPKDDIVPGMTIRLLDSIPPHIPNKHAAAACYEHGEAPPVIDLYLKEALGYLPDAALSSPFCGRLLNFIFLSLFGKVFIAASLFHEIGHLRQAVTIEHQSSLEEDAKQYENSLLSTTFPFRQRNYSVLNGIYRLLYRKRIAFADEKGKER